MDIPFPLFLLFSSRPFPFHLKEGLLPPQTFCTPADQSIHFITTIALHIKPVSVAVELFTVLHHGRKANLSLARFTQEKGAKSSFERVIAALQSVLSARGLLVEDEEKREDMMAVLVGDGSGGGGGDK